MTGINTPRLMQVKRHAIWYESIAAGVSARENREQVDQMNIRPLKAAVIAFLMAVISGIATSPAAADAQGVRRGKAIAASRCSYCHSIGQMGRSPRAAAPPFRILHEKYPVETLEDALAEGMSTGHPRMPEFRLEPDQVGDFISFLKSLEQ